jgi:membrane protease YdiL (CAAX protease family)
MKHLFRGVRVFALLIALTFIIPAFQWLAGKFLLPSDIGGVAASLLIIIAIAVWNRKTRSFGILPDSAVWRTIGCLGMPIAAALLAVNLRNAPVAGITGRARSPGEIIDVIILAPMAEELLFRGVIWAVLLAMFSKFGKKRSGFLTLLASSFLFGLEHIGYWLASTGTIHINAVAHAASMILAGICFGGVRQFSRSVSAPIIFHILANDIILLLQYLLGL